MQSTHESFVQFMREAKLPTSVTASIQPMKDLTRTEHVNLYRTAFHNILLDLRRAGYNTEEYDRWSPEFLDQLISEELFSMKHECYEAMPSKMDLFVSPLHRIADESQEQWVLSETPSSALEWRSNWEKYIPLTVTREEELPPRIYVHFACFPENTVFKEKQFMAVLNNLHENCGVTSKDTIVIITHNEANGTLLSRKMYQSYLNTVTKREEGNFAIHFTLEQLQFDLQSHLLVPPSRVIHCEREVRQKLEKVAYIENPVEELPEMDVDDPQVRRLFARPSQIIESMLCSENELDHLRYFVVKYKETNF